MLVTEEEALKLCCQEEFGFDSGALLMCVGSKCMAWRWRDCEFEQERRHESADPPEGENWKIVKHRVVFPPDVLWQRECLSRRGYCGKAGLPGIGEGDL